MASNWLEPHSPVHKVWKPELYKIQLDAPTPKALMRTADISEPIEFYGYEYHGKMDHRVSESLLKNTEDGTYLIRLSPGANDYYTLTVRFNGRTKHFKIYYKLNWGHFLKEDLKRYDTIHDLVADGLVNFYMQIHAAPIIQSMMLQTEQSYHQSPYMTLNRRKLRALSSDLRKSLKFGDENSLTTTTKLSTTILPSDIANTTTTAVTPTTSIIITGKELNILNKGSSNTRTSNNATGNLFNNDSLLSDSNQNTISSTSTTMTTTSSQDDKDEILPIIYEKSHKFKVNTFKGLNWCEFCANFLWGFTSQGVKCEDCGFIAHNKCSELVPAKCVPDLKRIRGCFGTDLTTLVAAHQCQIPFIVRRCVEEIESRGMFQEGIYRVSGFADEIEALKLALDRSGEKTDLSEAAYGNINVIAGTLKLYLRLLPIPLVTFQAYPEFINSTRCKSVGEQVISMRQAMTKLPPAHFNCLKFMIEHLSRIASHHAVNKMTEHNLATVFAPTLIAIPTHLCDLSEEIFMLSSLIANCHAVYC